MGLRLPWRHPVRVLGHWSTAPAGSGQASARRLYPGSERRHRNRTKSRKKLGGRSPRGVYSPPDCLRGGMTQTSELKPMPLVPRPDPSFSTQRLQGLLDRLQAGDPAAQDELLRRLNDKEPRCPKTA